MAKNHLSTPKENFFVKIIHFSENEMFAFVRGVPGGEIPKETPKANFFRKTIYFSENKVYNDNNILEGGILMSDIGNKEAFAKNLLYYINRHGKDQKEIAEIVGVAPSTFNAWVKAKKYPRIDKVERLASYFGILKSDLIEGHNSEESLRTASITEDEQKLLDLFRRVPESQQQLVLQMITAALKTIE